MHSSIIREHDRHNVTNSLNESQPRTLRDDMLINDNATFSMDTKKGMCNRKKIKNILKSSALSQCSNKFTVLCQS